MLTGAGVYDMLDVMIEALRASTSEAQDILWTMMVAIGRVNVLCYMLNLLLLTCLSVLPCHALIVASLITILGQPCDVRGESTCIDCTNDELSTILVLSCAFPW